MAECRDWLKTLWRSSYKGIPFWFEADKEKGGRDNVVHTFPHRDDPYIEDMGAKPRVYSGSAYVHGDDCDAAAQALIAACNSAGPGVLVLPYFGPVTVHCDECERSTQRDQMGYVAFELSFTRMGASAAIVSLPFLQNQAFTAADNVARLLGELFPQAIAVRDQPDFVVSAAADLLSTAAAVLDVQRQSYPIAPGASASLRNTIAEIFGELPAAFGAGDAGIAATAAALVGAVRQFADALPAATAIAALDELTEAFPAPAPAPGFSRTQIASEANAAAAARLVRLAALVAYSEAVLRATFAARPDGVTARANVAQRFEAELYETNGAESADLYVSVSELRDRVIDWLSQAITNLAPVVEVESAAIRPALDLAWTLYADPARAVELADRNRVINPLFMPRVVSALAR